MSPKPVLKGTYIDGQPEVNQAINTAVAGVSNWTVANFVAIGSNITFSADARITFTNNQMVFQYLVGGVWSNALEVIR